jgi:hypothetical protein
MALLMAIGLYLTGHTSSAIQVFLFVCLLEGGPRLVVFGLAKLRRLF